jgi:hypothetical protein
MTKKQNLIIYYQNTKSKINIVFIGLLMIN